MLKFIIHYCYFKIFPKGFQPLIFLNKISDSTLYHYCIIIVIVIISFHLKIGWSFKHQEKKKMHSSLSYYVKDSIIFSNSYLVKCCFWYANFEDFSASDNVGNSTSFKKIFAHYNLLYKRHLLQEYRLINDQILSWPFLSSTEHQEEKYEQAGDEYVPEVHRLPHEGEGESCKGDSQNRPEYISLWLTP